MPRYEIREREWPDAFKRPLKRPWGLYRDGVIIGMYETEEEAKAILAELPTEKEGVDADQA